MARPESHAIEEDAERSGPRRRESSREIRLTELGSAAELAAELPTLRRFAGYEVLGRLAAGGMAEVFLARERAEAGSVRLVALKVIKPQLSADPDFAEMFLREGKTALGLRHPNVCHTYRFGMEHGHPFLAMELVEGVTLRDLFARSRKTGTPIPAPIVVKIVATVAEALHSAHVARDDRGRLLGIVHQDVSPHNVMVAYDGTVKLLDFGVASTSTERALESSEVSQTTIRGKAGYLSPEQCTGQEIDARSDVFSLGIVLYEMLTATRLFARAQTMDSMRAIANEPLPAWPESIPAPLRRVLDRALARDVEQRYSDAAAMQEDLEHALAETRTAVTSAKIAGAMARVLGEDFGRAPKVEATRQAVAWLRAPEKDGTSAPIKEFVAPPSNDELEAIASPAPAPKANARMIGLGIAGVAFAVLVGLIAVALSGGDPPAPTPQPVAAAPVAPAPIAPSIPAPPSVVQAPEEIPAAAAPAAAIEASTVAPDAPSTAPRVVGARGRPVVRPRATRESASPSGEAPTSGGFVDDPGF